jgi:hypothetical protein
VRLKMRNEHLLKPAVLSAARLNGWRRSKYILRMFKQVAHPRGGTQAPHWERGRPARKRAARREISLRIEWHGERGVRAARSIAGGTPALPVNKNA